MANNYLVNTNFENRLLELDQQPAHCTVALKIVPQCDCLGYMYMLCRKTTYNNNVSKEELSKHA